MTKIDDALAGENETEASAVAKLVQLIDGDLPVQIAKMPDGRLFALHRDDFKVDNITPPHAQDVIQPQSVVAAIAVNKAKSLSDYVIRFKNAGTLLFASLEKNVIVAAIDYHRQPAARAINAGDASEGQTGLSDLPDPRLGTHTATLQLQPSEEWKRWIGMNEKMMDQVAFADYLEENAFDVYDPTGADLLELCRDLHATNGMQFRSVVRNGDVVKLSVDRESNATTNDGLEMPAEFKIAIPVYFGETSIKLTCLFRRKITGGALFLGFKIIRAEAERQREFQRIVDAVSVDSNVMALYGTK